MVGGEGSWLRCRYSAVKLDFGSLLQNTFFSFDIDMALYMKRYR